MTAKECPELRIQSLSFRYMYVNNWCTLFL